MHEDMSLLYGIITSLAVYGLLWFGRREMDRKEKDKAEAQRMALLDQMMKAEEEDQEGRRIADILVNLHTQLVKRHVSGFSPWIAACVDNADRLTRQVALTAIDKTEWEVTHPERRAADHIFRPCAHAGLFDEAREAIG